MKVKELVEVELAKQGVSGYKLEWYRDPDWGYVYIVEFGLNARRALDSGVEGAIDLFYFLVSHRYMADPFHLTYYIKEVLNDSDVVHIGHWISDYSLMIRTLRVKNKIPANTRILYHVLIRPLSIKSEVRYLNKDTVVYSKINAIRHILSSYDAITVSTPYELQLLKLLGLNNVYLVGETIDTDFLRKTNLQ